MATGTSFTDYLSDAFLNEAFRNSNFAAVATCYLALFSTAPTDAYTSGAPTGVELSGNAYARQVIAFGAPTSPGPSGRQVANSGVITFPTATPGSQGTVVAIGVFDAVSGGNLLAWNTVATRTIAAGEFYQTPIGAGTILLD